MLGFLVGERRVGTHCSNTWKQIFLDDQGGDSWLNYFTKP